MKKFLFIFPFLVTALGCGGGSQPAAATPQSGSRISVSPNSTLLHCIGTAPGQPPPQKIGPSPATMNYCRQLPGWALYEQAGEHFKSGDHTGAAKIVINSAKAGNPIAQLRLAMLYEAGDGVPRDKKEAFAWYLRAAQAGEPGAQSEVGGYYEEGDGVPENWPVAVQWYQQSASQGWMLQKLVRQFQADLSEMRRLQTARGDPRFADLARAREYTQQMRERYELRGPSPTSRSAMYSN